MADYFVDRVVEHPGRVQMTPVSGQSNVYDMERAEGAVTETGTSFNAATFNNIAQDILDKITEQANRITELENRETVKTVTVSSGSVSIGAGLFGAIQIQFTPPAGYKAVGIGEVVLHASGALMLYFTINSQSQITIGCRNVTTQPVTQSVDKATILCVPIV